MQSNGVIILNDVSSEGMRALIEYTYTSRVTLSLTNIENVLSAASHLQFLDVIEACSSYLEEQMNIDNCVDVATIAETYSLNSLKKKLLF
ncbi:kelch-like protein 26 [Dinothrombium tinctorium]|uniref:Kelch-like protein 26 n=1 Tax=Dinothrombium tinctorium TaxID=1965070 RepID=A0A3S3S4R3_9ACAR|nr:kelch-like protein 26 [Dinothrombium tinctorium]RWS10346.1 kelch-like protein 26 [Dinothrombium tinctorium]